MRLSDKKAYTIAVILEIICWLIVLFALICIVMFLLGRVNINRLTTPEGHYTNVLLLEKDHNTTSRVMLVNISNLDISLRTGGKVGFITWLSIALMGIVKIFPMGYCFFMLARFFRNISNARVFVTDNANLLFKSGIAFILAFPVTLVFNTFIFPLLVTSLTSNELTTVVTPKFSELFYGAILLVMAYVFHYGIGLQDEADHTL